MSLDVETLLRQAIASTNLNASNSSIAYDLDCLRLKLFLLEIGIKPGSIEEIPATSRYQNNVLVEIPHTLKFTVLGLNFQLILRKNGIVQLNSGYAVESFQIGAISPAGVAAAIVKVGIQLQQR